MIKIDVYDHAESARKVFEAFYELIVNAIPFPNGAIKRAFENEFRERYGENLELIEHEDIFNRKLNDNKRTYKKILEKYGFKCIVDTIEKNKEWNAEEILIYFNYTLAKAMIQKIPGILYARIYPDANSSASEIYTFPQDENDNGYSFLKKNYDKYNRIRINVDMLGKLLCGYMDDPVVREFCEQYKTIKKIAIDSYFNKDNIEWDVYRRDLLENVFRFNHLNMKKTYAFVSSLGIAVCPYCNRNYIQVISKEQGKNKEHQTRPQLDHFINKDEYPFLAVSMMNLVPSCAPCNLGKSNNEQRILYPYKEGISDKYRFSIKTINSIRYLTKSQGCESEFGLEIEKSSYDANDDFDARVKGSAEMFGWNDLYEMDKSYALKVYQNSYIFNKDFQKSIVEAMPGLFSSITEVQRILNPKLVSVDRFNSEPLSKLTYDISEQARSDRED